MGMLIDGQWTESDPRVRSSTGEFVRSVSPYRQWVGRDVPAVRGRYHLFVNAGCPWAYRTILYRARKGLGDAIGMSVAVPAMRPEGWTFGETPESILGAIHLHDVYTASDPAFTGRCTVPVLWDLEAGTIVNNESADIMRMMNSAFDELEGVETGTDYHPADLASEIDALNAWIYEDVSNGVYRCGFASSQSAYDAAFDRLFEALDRLEERLSTRRYLCGDRVTEADWRLFSTLVRFDAAYYGQFRCNRNLISQMTQLWGYARDLYQRPGVAETVDFEAIKGIYYGSRPPGILPRGPRLDWDAAHGRG